MKKLVNGLSVDDACDMALEASLDDNDDKKHEENIANINKVSDAWEVYKKSWKKFNKEYLEKDFFEIIAYLKKNGLFNKKANDVIDGWMNDIEQIFYSDSEPNEMKLNFGFGGNDIFESKEKKKMKRLEEKRIDEEDRINALAEFLGLDEEEKEEIEVDRHNDKLLTYDGDEYLVVDDDEADEEFEDYQRALWDDMGIESFSESFQDWIMSNAIDSSWFEDAMDESNRFYAEDIKNESSREYANRLVEECYDNGLIDDDDFEKDEDGEPNYEECTKDEDDLIDMLVDYMREDDAIRWYRDTFGDDDFKKVVIDNNLVDFDEVIDEVKSWDGRGCLAGYDGVENEEGDFFIYRTN